MESQGSHRLDEAIHSAQGNCLTQPIDSNVKLIQNTLTDTPRMRFIQI